MFLEFRNFFVDNDDDDDDDDYGAIAENALFYFFVLLILTRRCRSDADRNCSVSDARRHCCPVLFPTLLSSALCETSLRLRPSPSASSTYDRI